MGQTLAEFGSYQTPTLKQERKKTISASPQALNVLKKKNVDIQKLTAALQDFCEEADVVWCYLGKRCFTISIDVVFRKQEAS